MYDCTILQDCWSGKYHCWFVLLDAQNFGTSSRRQRMFGFCAHKRSILKIWSSLENVLPLFFRLKLDSFCFQRYLIATEEELDQELIWAMKRRCSKAKGMNLPFLKLMKRPFWECLTPNLCNKWVHGNTGNGHRKKWDRES